MYIHAKKKTIKFMLIGRSECQSACQAAGARAAAGDRQREAREALKFCKLSGRCQRRRRRCRRHRCRPPCSGSDGGACVCVSLPLQMAHTTDKQQNKLRKCPKTHSHTLAHNDTVPKSCISHRHTLTHTYVKKQQARTYATCIDSDTLNVWYYNTLSRALLCECVSLRSLKRQCASALPVVHTHSLADRLCALLLPFVRTGTEVGRTNICARCRRRRCQRQTKRPTLPVMPEQSRVCYGCAVLCCLPACLTAKAPVCAASFIQFLVFGFQFTSNARTVRTC